MRQISIDNNDCENGVALSQMMQWDGMRVLCIAKNALTDCNYHSEAKKIEEIISSLIPL
jgi:hypothetical protein